MFAKLFNLFRGKPLSGKVIPDHIPLPPEKETVSTTRCGCRHCGPRKERPQRSTRELKPQIKRPDFDSVVNDENQIINSIVMGSVANYPEEHKSSPVETTNDSDPCEYGGCDCD